MNKSNNLCKSCSHRFRRVYIPLNPENYIDDEGNKVFDGEDNIIISISCLAGDVDIQDEDTVECSHYKPKEFIEDDIDEVSIFRDTRFNKLRK